jgi:hypothetical protein
MAYQLVYHDRGFVIRFFGDVSDDEIDQGNGEIHGHSEFDTHRYQIVDFREARLLNVSTKKADEAAAIDVVASRTNFHVRIALVVADAHSFNLSKMFAEKSREMGSPWEYAIFEDYTESLKWAKQNT